MKYGVNLVGMSPRLSGEVAADAEANGFESVWLGERVVFRAHRPRR